MAVDSYPFSPKVRQTDEYHGVTVADPYRWLEDERHPDRAGWIQAQNELTAAYLSRLPVRAVLLTRFAELLDCPRHYDFIRRGPYLFFRRNNGLQNQLTLCVQSLRDGATEVLIDPCVENPDGTTRVTAVVPSRNARYLAYGLARFGGDWEEYRIKDMATRKDLAERLQWVKASSIGWCGNGFYYSRYPAPQDPTMTSAPNERHQVWYHRVATSQAEDVLIYQDTARPRRLHTVNTTEDERFLLLSVWDKTDGGQGNALYCMDIALAGGSFRLLIAGFEHTFRVIDSDGDSLLVMTNSGASNWRLVRIDLSNPDARNWCEVLPERGERVEHVCPAGGKLFAIYQTGVSHRLCVFSRTGVLEAEIPLPGVGVAQVFRGQPDDDEVFWSFSDFTTPRTFYRYSISAGSSSVFCQPVAAFNPSDFETTYVMCPTKDGVQIPAFVVHRKGLELDGSHACLLNGYGGNGASVAPSFDPFLIALLERGVVYVVACLRGGGEFGDRWHRSGRREYKQNVFDDCIAVTEWLQASGYTNPERMALIGASNGGLLVGAVMTQRPDLFKVALPDVGVMDMLRFQHYTLGSSWIAEYGSSDDPAMFPVLLRYSPLHNIKVGVRYPATLVTTSEHDDRVVPMHSFKFVAALQSNGERGRPYLLRVDTHSAHGPVSLPKAMAERADVYAFLLDHVGDDAGDVTSAARLASQSRRNGADRRPPERVDS